MTKTTKEWIETLSFKPVPVWDGPRVNEWDIESIRNEVLEAAEQKCLELAPTFYHKEMREAAEACAKAIRDLKDETIIATQQP